MLEARSREGRRVFSRVEAAACLREEEGNEKVWWDSVLGYNTKHHKPCDACDGVHMGYFWDLVWASNTKRSDGANESVRRD